MDIDNKNFSQPFDISQLVETGYIKIKVNKEIISCMGKIFASGEVFFHLDKSVKKKNAAPHLCDEGWTDLGYEYNVDRDRPDLAEGFWVAPKYVDQTKHIYKEALDLMYAMQKYSIMINEITRSMTREIIRYFNLPSSLAKDFHFEHDSECELLYYRPAEHDRDLLQDPHEDGLFLSFLRSTAPGLQILINNQYEDVNLQEDEILVISGEILTLLTGGKIKPLFHRVVRYENYIERFTLVYFTFPDLIEGSVMPPWIQSNENKDIDILEKVRENAYQKFALKTSQID